MAHALRSAPRNSAARASAAGHTTPREAADADVALIADLPPAGTRYWVPRHKAAVVAAVRAGILSLAEARRRYRLSEEEFQSWQDTIDRYGIVGLRMSMSERRAAPRVAASERGSAMLNADARAQCLITDVSDQGARLEFPAKIALPNLFELACETSGRAWWVDLVWQRGESAGVRFTNPLVPPFAIVSGLGAWLIGKADTVAIDRKD